MRRATNSHSGKRPAPHAAGRPARADTARRGFRLGTGWLPEPPDTRDHTWHDESVNHTLEKAGVSRALARDTRLPERVDLRRFCPPIHFQGGFNTCSAHVVTTLLEFFELKAFGRSVDASRLFLHKVTQNLLQTKGDGGVYIRQTMGALKLIGAPPERFWPYPDPGTLAAPRRQDARFDQEPTAFCYALADDYRAISYYRLDEGSAAREETESDHLLHRLKAHLAGQIPVAFGFPLHASAIKQSLKTGRLPYPAPADAQVGNHAAVAVGYDDHIAVANVDAGAGTTTGAVLIHNSWSTAWGEDGYGWLPYEYVLRGRAKDFWTLLKADWIDTGHFQLGFDL